MEYRAELEYRTELSSLKDKFCSWIRIPNEATNSPFYEIKSQLHGPIKGINPSDSTKC